MRNLGGDALEALRRRERGRVPKKCDGAKSFKMAPKNGCWEKRQVAARIWPFTANGHYIRKRRGSRKKETPKRGDGGKPCGKPLEEGITSNGKKARL